MAVRATRAGRGVNMGLPADKKQVEQFIIRVQSGLTDEYLRAMWDAIATRKAALESAGGLPTQIRVAVDPAVRVRAADLQPVDDDDAAEFVKEKVTAKKAPAAPRKSNGKFSLGYAKVDPVMDVSLMGSIKPLPSDEWRDMEEFRLFKHGGFTYRKADIMGLTVYGTIDNTHIKFEIDGAGAKALKCLMLTAPKVGSVSGKTDLHQAFIDRTPVFMPHNLIAWMLQHPTDTMKYV